MGAITSYASPYPYDKDNPYLVCVSKQADIDLAIAAMLDVMNTERGLGFDCEWKVDFDMMGNTVRQYKPGLFQFAYFNGNHDDRIQHLFIRTHRTQCLSRGLLSLSSNNSINLVGVNVGGDLARIGRKLGAGESIAMRNKETIINLGQYAHKRDVVQSGAVGLKELIKIVLGFHVDKSTDDTFSNWNADNLTPHQVKYALIDVDASLRVYDKLWQKPDLTARLTMKDIVVGKIVDLVPWNGSVACMATRTRAASGIIVDDIICYSPPGITQKKVRAGQGMVTIKLEKVYSPSLQIPYYTRSGAREKPMLAEFGLGKIVVPVQMLKDHVNSGSIRITETVMIGLS
jgi:hypothetical protein